MNRERIIKEISKNKIKPIGSKIEYNILEKLGSGGNGVVFKVKNGEKELVSKFYIPPDRRDLDKISFGRFEQEIELTKKIRHPYVIRSNGVGCLEISSYRIPFYLMPKALGTFRDKIPKDFDLNNIFEIFQIYLRALLGISNIHSKGIFHRDIKPENILMFENNSPCIADLGIAHVLPGFVKSSKLTTPAAKLMNQDYYAPEQRYGDATKVDYRVDIYALGCILYEMVSGIPATRPNLPNLKDFDPRLDRIDSIIKKMTQHNPAKRYQYIDLVIDDIIWAIKSLDINSKSLFKEEDDIKLLSKYLRSTNSKTQEQAHDIAFKLGHSSLPVLIELLGDRRLDVSISAYKILGDLSDNDSIQYLIAGLYPRRTSKKLNFPTGEVSAKAINKFPINVKLDVLNKIEEYVLASNIRIIIDDLPKKEVYDLVLSIYNRKLFYEDWKHQTGLSLLLSINENKTWPIVEDLLNKDKSIYSLIIFEDIFPYVSKDHKKFLIDYLLSNIFSLSKWELPRILNEILSAKFDEKFQWGKIDQLEKISDIVFKKYYERIEFIKELNKVRNIF